MIAWQWLLFIPVAFIVGFGIASMMAVGIYTDLPSQAVNNPGNPTSDTDAPCDFPAR